MEMQNCRLIFLVIFLNISLFKLCAQKNNLLSSHGFITLKSDKLILNINNSSGLPYNYNLKGNIIWGEDSGQKIQTVICRLHPRNYFSVTVVPSIIKKTETEADILFNVAYENNTAAAFHIRYILKNASVMITMEQVTEQIGYELIEASMPDLATVRQEDGTAWLAHGLGGGAVVDLNNKGVHAYTLPDDEYFGSIGYVLPVAIVGTSKAVCAMEISAFMDGTKIEIAGSNHHLHARIGTVQVYRVHGGRSYNMNDGNDAVAGNENTPNLLVGQISRCRLDFAGDYDSNGRVDWLDGAKIIAERMPPSPTKYFNDKFIYLIGGKYKLENEPRTTFAQSEQLIKDISMLTDFAPQMPLISGWVYDGQDTGFPSEDSVNETLGGYQALKHLLSQGAKYNANVSFNTNYDDAYKSSTLFDTAFIARRPDGKIWRSRDWAGEYSYIVGMAKYMTQWGAKRIDYMMDHYKIHDALLIDAMSWFAIRNDWDINHPASGYKNLADGKFKIIDEFEKRGVHVISEQLRYPFIGKLAVTADGTGNGTCPFGGEPIPLVAAIYRKSAIWGTGDFSRNDQQRNLFWNCRSIQWYVNASDRSSITDFYYLTVLPFNKVHDLAIQSYNRNGFHTLIGLSHSSSIENDWMSQDYSIKLNGIEIAAHGATFCPLDTDRIACYSRNGQEIAVDLPGYWNADSLAVRALFNDHREPFHYEIENKKIVVNVPAARPIIIYRNAAIADKLH